MMIDDDTPSEGEGILRASKDPKDQSLGLIVDVLPPIFYWSVNFFTTTMNDHEVY